MFESAIIKLLSEDDDLASLLTVFDSSPAIFAERAPKAAMTPFIIFKIDRSSNECPAVQEFTVLIDLYDYDKSRVNSNKAIERIEFLLDRAEIEHERYSKIRLVFFAGSYVEETDPRDIHYNMQFLARAGRKKWVQQL